MSLFENKNKHEFIMLMTRELLNHPVQTSKELTKTILAISVIHLGAKCIWIANRLLEPFIPLIDKFERSLNKDRLFDLDP